MDYTLSHLVDAARLRRLTDLWYKATGIPFSVIDPDGSVLAHSGRPEICGHFCAPGPATGEQCNFSDTRISMKVGAGRKYTMERCRHGLVHASTPLTVDGEHIGRFAAGPFFFTPPDMGLFQRHAVESGLDESACLDAVARVPLIDKTRTDVFLQWFSVLTGILFHAGVTKAAAGKDRRARVEADAPDCASTAREGGRELRREYRRKYQGPHPSPRGGIEEERTVRCSGEHRRYHRDQPEGDHVAPHPKNADPRPDGQGNHGRLPVKAR